MTDNVGLEYPHTLAHESNVFFASKLIPIIAALLTISQGLVFEVNLSCNSRHTGFT